MPTKRAIKEMIGSLPTRRPRHQDGQDALSCRKLIPGVHHKLPGGAQDDVKAIYKHAEEHNEEFNLYIKGEEGDELADEPDDREDRQSAPLRPPTPEARNDG